MSQDRIESVERRLEAADVEVRAQQLRAKALGQSLRDSWGYSSGGGQGLQSVFQEGACGIALLSVVTLLDPQYGTFHLSWLPSSDPNFIVASPSIPGVGAFGGWFGCRAVNYPGAGAVPANQIGMRFRAYALSTAPYWFQLFEDITADPVTLLPIAGDCTTPLIQVASSFDDGTRVCVPWNRVFAFAGFGGGPPGHTVAGSYTLLNGSQ